MIRMLCFRSPFKSLDASLLGHIKETLLVTISDRIANRDGWTGGKINIDFDTLKYFLAA